jgi:hypothetical protein
VHVTRSGAAVIAVVIAVVTGCTAAPDPEEVEQPRLSVELLQYRRDQADRVVEVQLHNDSQHVADVSRLQLLTPRFAGTAPVEPRLTLAGGDTVDVRVPLGDSACGDVRDTPPVVRIWRSDDDTHVDVPASASDAVLEPIRAKECAEKTVSETVPMRWDDWRIQRQGEDRVVAATLHVGPVAGGLSAHILSVESTTLWSAATEALPVDLQAAETAALPVTFTPQRCDPHAVGESKRGYAFEVRVALGSEPPDSAALVTLPPEEEARRLLEKTLLERCSLAVASP